jgi:hypothetical protein
MSSRVRKVTTSLCHLINGHFIFQSRDFDTESGRAGDIERKREDSEREELRREQQ